MGGDLFLAALLQWASVLTHSLAPCLGDRGASCQPLALFLKGRSWTKESRDGGVEGTFFS